MSTRKLVTYLNEKQKADSGWHFVSVFLEEGDSLHERWRDRCLLQLMYKSLSFL